MRDRGWLDAALESADHVNLHCAAVSWWLPTILLAFFGFLVGLVAGFPNLTYTKS